MRKIHLFGVLVPVTLSISASMFAGCTVKNETTTPTADGGTGGSPDASLPPAAGGTGAFGIITVGGKQKMYLPLGVEQNSAGHSIVAVVDVGTAGNGANGAPALLTDVDLGTESAATTTGGDATMVVAASTKSPDIWFIDPTKDVLVKHITLDSTYGQSAFSGGGGYVTGIAADPNTHQAVLSVWNGFAIVDLATQSIVKTIAAPPSENFGFDSVHGRILAPWYQCDSSADSAGNHPAACAAMTDADGGTQLVAGLNVIDIASGTVYRYFDPQAKDPTSPLGGEPDSASIDPTTQLLVVPAEGDGYESIIDLSKGTFDANAKTVTAPRVQLQGLDLEGVAVEYQKHFAFFEGEGSGDVAVADLGAVAGGATKYVRGTMPDTPAAMDGGTTGSWENLGDPHGIAVTTGISDGHSVGFLVDHEFQWVARVDLEKMNALTGAPNADGSVTVEQPALAPAVTYLNARQKP